MTVLDAPSVINVDLSTFTWSRCDLQKHSIIRHLWMILADSKMTRTRKVSIAEKGSLWHSLLTPGKQMCPKRQALNPDTSQLRSQTFNCDRRFIERSLVPSFLWSAFCHRGGGDSRKRTHTSLHLWRHHIVRLAHWSVKSWGWVHYDVVVTLSAAACLVWHRDHEGQVFLVEPIICIYWRTRLELAVAQGSPFLVNHMNFWRNRLSSYFPWPKHKFAIVM